MPQIFVELYEDETTRIGVKIVVLPQLKPFNRKDKGDNEVKWKQNKWRVAVLVYILYGDSACRGRYMKIFNILLSGCDFSNSLPLCLSV